MSIWNDVRYFINYSHLCMVIYGSIRKPVMLRFFFLCAVWIISGCTSPTMASPTAGSLFDMLNQEGVLDISIETDLTVLINDRRRDTYQPGVLSFKSKDGQSWRFNVELIPRGKFRRRICDFPPVKIKFPKKELSGKGFSKYNHLKLNTHCLDDKDVGNFNVFKEYLVYKMYNALTDNSFRVQLTRITYIDAARQLPKLKRYGFLMEDDEELAERMGGVLTDSMNLDVDKIAAREAVLMSCFEYMIGNEDWDITMIRNIEMVNFDHQRQSIPVPYDFDFSGVVNASYAIPLSSLGQQHIKDRDYLGMEVSPELFHAVLQIFITRKDTIYALVRDFKRLPQAERDDILQYLDTFYEQLAALRPDQHNFPPWRYAAYRSR
jgi:hypothetical protein